MLTQPEHVGSEGAGGVDPLRLLEGVDPLQSQGAHLLGLFVLELARHIDECAVAGEVGEEIRLVDAEHRRQQPGGDLRVLDLLGIGVHRRPIDGHRDLAALGVEDGAPAGGQLPPGESLLQALRSPAVALDDLDVEQARSHADPSEHDQRADGEQPRVREADAAAGGSPGHHYSRCRCPPGGRGGIGPPLTGTPPGTVPNTSTSIR